MIIVKNNTDYTLSFPISNKSNNTATNVRTQITLDNTKLQLVSMNSSIGVVGVAGEWVFGTLGPNTSYVLNVVVKVLQQVQDLNVTCTVTTSTSETNTLNNSKTLNLLTELQGILCSEVGSCGSTITGLTNPLATNLDANNFEIFNENIQEFNTRGEALVALGPKRKFRYTSNSTTGLFGLDVTSI